MYVEPLRHPHRQDHDFIARAELPMKFHVTSPCFVAVERFRCATKLHDARWRVCTGDIRWNWNWSLATRRHFTIKHWIQRLAMTGMTILRGVDVVYRLIILRHLRLKRPPVSNAALWIGHDWSRLMCRLTTTQRPSLFLCSWPTLCLSLKNGMDMKLRCLNVGVIWIDQLTSHRRQFLSVFDSFVVTGHYELPNRWL